MFSFKPKLKNQNTVRQEKRPTRETRGNLEQSFASKLLGKDVPPPQRVLYSNKLQAKSLYNSKFRELGGVRVCTFGICFVTFLNLLSVLVG